MLFVVNGEGVSFSENTNCGERKAG